VFGPPSFPKTRLRSFPFISVAIERLILCRVTFDRHLFDAFTSSFIHLVALTLHGGAVERSWFASTTFPSLRILYSTVVHLDPTSHRASLVQPATPSQDRLDVFQVRLGRSPGVFETLKLRPHPVLLSFDFLDGAHLYEHPFISHEHFLLIAPASSPKLPVVLFLKVLVGSLRLHEHIRSLSLPSFLSPSSPLSPALAAVRGDLLSVCRARNIDIVWRFKSKRAEDDVAVSKDFWEYAKELKRKKERVEAEGASLGASG
jgi:hypothetical protein